MGLRDAVTKLRIFGMRTPSPINSLYSQFDSRSKLVSSYFGRVSNAFTLPERFRGTFLERWSDYWRAVYKDYKEVMVDAATDLRTKPFKTAFLTTVAGTTIFCAQRNPDETSFRDTFIKHSNDFIFVGPPIRNPKTTNHLRMVEQFYNEGIIRRFSLGVFSIMWVDNYRDNVGAYKATCQYLSPSWLNFRQRIIDVGFLNRWWILEKKMVDCDVNPEEWIEECIYCK